MKFKKGDRVKLTKGGYGLSDSFVNDVGTIDKVFDGDKKLPYAVNLDKLKDWMIPFVFCSEDMLELVEDEKPNTGIFKIRALENRMDLLTKGKVYTFLNGRTTFDNGMLSNKYADFEELITKNSKWRNIIVEVTEFNGLSEGDEVRVTTVGLTYFRYDNWSHLGEWKKNFVMESTPSRYKLYKIILIAEHDNRSSTLALIQDQDTSQVFIMPIERLELIKKHEVETK